MTTTDPSPCPLLTGLGALAGAIGAVALFVTNVVASRLATEHDWRADTVSALAAGSTAWIQDIGLYAYGAGLIALAIAAGHLRLGGVRWSAGVLALAGLAFVVTAIGVRDNASLSTTAHAAFAYAMGVLWFVAPMLMADGLARLDRWRGRASIAAGVAWALASAVFFLAPDDWDGLAERVMGGVTVLWVLVLSTSVLAARRAGRAVVGRLEDRAVASS